MFKVKTGCASNITKEIFEIDNRYYNFQHDFFIKRHNVQSVYYGSKTVSFVGYISDTLPNSCKEATSLKVSKRILKGTFLKIVPADYAKLMFNV